MGNLLQSISKLNMETFILCLEKQQEMIGRKEVSIEFCTQQEPINTSVYELMIFI